MKIDGKLVAETLLAGLAHETAKLKKSGITPTVSVILVGNDPASRSYIKQKQKAAQTIGARLELHELPVSTTTDTLRTLIEKQNADNTIHGIIVQRPIPPESPIDGAVLAEVSPAKDVDGFVQNSPYHVPVARAVYILLLFAKTNTTDDTDPEIKKKFLLWLQTQTVVVIGRGETAGKPIADFFRNQGCTTHTIHSHTANPKLRMKQADILVSCVGKPRVVSGEDIQSGVICISVGIWRDNTGKLHGDYEEEDVEPKAAFYTPTPGGVGPVNVACLMGNLLQAAHITIG